jgi:hypothetical protein
MVFVVCICGILASLSGCYTLEKTKDFTPYSPVGIVSIASNYDINWTGEAETKTSAVGDSVTRRINPKTVNNVKVSKADVLINDAEAVFRTVVEGSGIAPFSSRDDVLNAPSYIEAKENNRFSYSEEKWDKSPLRRAMIPADGYRIIDYRDKAFAAKLAAEAGVQSLMYVTFDITKEMATGVGKNGHFRANVVMQVVITDIQGKVIYRKNFNSYSGGRASVSMGTYDHEDLLEISRMAIEDACYSFLDIFSGK